MPEALIRPLDYPGSKLICPHQTIWSFIPFTKYSETDIEYYLFPEERWILHHNDDISIRNDQTIDLNTWFLTTNNINVTTQELPGNIGIWTVDHLPIQISKLYKDRKHLKESLACDPSNTNLPEDLTQADKVDYPSDEDQSRVHYSAMIRFQPMSRGGQSFPLRSQARLWDN